MYRHTQKAPVYLFLLGNAFMLIVLGWISLHDVQPWVSVLGIVMGIIFLLFAMSFAQLTVMDDGDTLGIQYGPFRLFRKRILYAEIESVDRGRSAFIDGWGIHYLPWRGWTYNLWGFDCVILRVNGKVIRVGSDDADNLNAFLQEKVGSNGIGA
jgi:hypothetical protein